MMSVLISNSLWIGAFAFCVSSSRSPVRSRRLLEQGKSRAPDFADGLNDSLRYETPTGSETTQLAMSDIGHFILSRRGATPDRLNSPLRPHRFGLVGLGSFRTFLYAAAARIPSDHRAM
jgi:hypothetical protein